VTPCNFVNSYQFFGILCLPNYTRHARENRHINMFLTLITTQILHFLLACMIIEYVPLLKGEVRSGSLKFHNVELCSVFLFL